MARFQRDDGSLFYDLKEGGRPILVLSHGFGMSSRVFKPLAEKVHAAGFGVLSYDQRCCGDSDSQFTDVSVASQGEDLAGLIEQLGLDQVVLNGWSFGGAVVLNAAARLGDRCLGLISTAGAMPRYTQTDDFPHGGNVEDVDATVAAITANPETVLRGLYYEGVFAAPVDESVKALCFEIAMEAAPGANAALSDLARADQRAELAALGCPGLILHGDADGVVPLGISEAAADLMKDCELVVLPGVGHAPFLEAEETYTQHVLDFMKRVTG